MGTIPLGLESSSTDISLKHTFIPSFLVELYHCGSWGQAVLLQIDANRTVDALDYTSKHSFGNCSPVLR